MASHPHDGQNSFPTAPIAATTTTTTTITAPNFCSCAYNHCCSQPPPPLQSIDPVLQALSFLLQQQQQRQLPNSHACFSKHHTHENHHKNLHFHPQKLHFEQLREDQQTHSVISSLLQRISSLEASFQRLFTSSASNKHFHPSYSLREAAARIIQAHFRAFLVRRSRTLSQLQDLAFIKSSFNSLKSSISNKTHFNYGMISQKATDLLLKLDSIQGRDPMIRDGKRSVSRDIIRFLEVIDALDVIRHGSLNKPVKNVKLIRNKSTPRAFDSNIGYGDFSGTQKEIGEKVTDRVGNIHGFSRVCDNVEEDVELEGFQEFIDEDEDEDDGGENNKVFINGKPSILKMRNGVLMSAGNRPRVKKTVSFAENGNVYRIFHDPHESVLEGDDSFADGSDSSGDHGENVDSNEFKKRKGTIKIGENDEVGQDENATSSHSSDDGVRNPTRNLRSQYYQINRYCQDEDGNLVFSAPEPVKMESRADLMKKRTAMKLV